MIKVTRLNGNDLVINSDLIEFVEEMPDTIITLVSGKKIMVQESSDLVIEKVAEFKWLASGIKTPKEAVI
ncbi:MAG: flagellar FlbD family protein [candidate division Zixibacteria bacterium]|nr:flagellar FlbD family protein [candidate division Zixibacteria bacterium]